ncbi:uncharacterized protein Dvir_GJ16705 [Drosophila virilis]|uniref:Uncharacterized protein n=1 Tax=Drosophila virilis TaxID=7244 RepID=B4M7Z4_DROVI|nr:uncharacterized protein Dvir_GJ16705 [Drosophila virilis]
MTPAIVTAAGPTGGPVTAEEMRQRCGTVYTWNCAGELYGIECELCEERPLCALDEFAEHMELWHSDWQQSPVDELMLEVLAEQSSGGEVNELKQQLVQELNALDAAHQSQHLTETLQLNNRIKYDLNRPLPDVEPQKLTSEHVQHLIELYQAHPRLWDQSHPEFRDVDRGRESWQQITDAWSAHCGRSFSVTDVRIRISTLCQRFLKQRERVAAEGELEESIKFVHYDQLRFLCAQQSLLKRQEHYAHENRKLLELYEHYPILWHNAHKRLRCAETVRQRHEAHRGLQLALRMCGVKLSGLAIQRRLQSLRKRYRLEKIRYLHSVVEGKQAEFVSGFEHYAEMEFLHKHIDPYVCASCGKIFENLVSHQAHVQGNCEEQALAGQETVHETDATVGELMALVEMEHEVEVEVEAEAEVEVEPKEQLATEHTDELPEEHTELLEPEPEPEQAQTEAEIVAEVESQAQPADEITTRLHSLATACAEDVQPTAVGAGEDLTETSSEGSLSPGVQLRMRLSLDLTHRLIELYQEQPHLWDPNHLDYHDRQLRRQAWHGIAAELNAYAGCPGRFGWQMLHRKLTDYIKYYRRERQREALAVEGSGVGTRWGFYEAFSFLDDVVPINCVLQKSLQQRDSNLKIIQVYQSYEQLWCTQHPDYTKRKQRLRHLESLCTRLQEECNLQISVERLKSRLIEFRCQYRQCKEARQAALRRGEDWQPSYEYYVPLQFLELHISPFGCGHCSASFKRRSDYLRHQRNRRRGRSNQSQSVGQNPLEHICHICAMKFSLRSSLQAHLRRHLGQRTHACSDCPKKFFNSTALQVHRRSHTKELPYVCEHCARGFVNASKLNQHVKRHTEKRDHPCSRCDKAFYTAHERDRHMRAHLNIRDKVCPYCARAFVVGSAYYAHLNLHRGEKRYSCSGCGQRFAQYAGLYKHRKRCSAIQSKELKEK